jgi:hypothetical protein
MNTSTSLGDSVSLQQTLLYPKEFDTYRVEENLILDVQKGDIREPKNKV